jgi:hypothetical protein
MDRSGNGKVSAIRMFLGGLSGIVCGIAVSATILVVGIAIIWLLMFFMAFLSTLPAFFYILFILAGLAAMALAVLTYVAMYAAAGVYSNAVYNSVAGIRAPREAPFGIRFVGACAAALSVPPFFQAIQAIVSHWRIGDFNELLVKLFGTGFSAADLQSWGWLVWLNLLAGTGIAVASSWSKTDAEAEEATDEG